MNETDRVPSAMRMAWLARTIAGAPLAVAEVERWVEYTDRLEAKLRDLAADLTRALRAWEACAEALSPTGEDARTARQQDAAALRSDVAYVRLLLGDVP